MLSGFAEGFLLPVRRSAVCAALQPRDLRREKQISSGRGGEA